MGQMGAYEQKRQCLAGTTVGSRMAGRYPHRHDSQETVGTSLYKGAGQK